MKTIKILVAILFSAIVFSSCSDKEIEIELKGDTYYLKGAEEVFSGRCVEYYENGEKLYEGTIEEGKKEGLWIWYHENGQKRLEESYSKGLLNGLRKGFDEKGTLLFSTNYQFGYNKIYK